MDLRTRYTALVTLITQYVKFASETLKRTEDEEVRCLFNTQHCYFRASAFTLIIIIIMMIYIQKC